MRGGAWDHRRCATFLWQAKAPRPYLYRFNTLTWHSLARHQTLQTPFWYPQPGGTHQAQSRASTTAFCAFTCRANAIIRALWPRVVHREIFLLFPCVACHALPWLPHVRMLLDAFLANPCSITPFPLPCRETCSRLLFLAFIAWPFFTLPNLCFLHATAAAATLVLIWHPKNGHL